MGRKTEVRSDLYTKEALLRLARTQKNNRASRRLLGIAHALGGMTISAAAQAAGMERQALGDAIKRYNAEGLEGLFDRAKPGRPRKLDAAQEKELSELLIQGPDPDKDGVSAYTLDDLVEIAGAGGRLNITLGPCPSPSSGLAFPGRRRGPIIIG